MTWRSYISEDLSMKSTVHYWKLFMNSCFPKYRSSSDAMKNQSRKRKDNS